MQKLDMTGLGSQDTLRFQFPSCWEDDVTMSGRFAIPRSETVNPYDWPGKFKFWKDLIIEWASFNKKLTIEYEELKNAFTRKGKYPATLERVLTEMNKYVYYEHIWMLINNTYNQRQGIIHLQDQYLYQNTKSSWTSWGIGLVKTSVSWSWSKVMSALVEIEREAPRYVVPSVLQVFEIWKSGFIQLILLFTGNERMYFALTHCCEWWGSRDWWTWGNVSRILFWFTRGPHSFNSSTQNWEDRHWYNITSNNDQIHCSRKDQVKPEFFF